MIYNRLDKLPYKLFMEVLETSDYSKLTDETTDPSELEKIWFSLYDEFLKINPTKDEDRVIKIQREVYYFEAKYKLISTYCRLLRFDYYEDIISELREYGYSIDADNYLTSVERIEREASALLVKAEKFREQLPKIDGEKPKISIDEMFASYSAILGFDFDYDTISVTKTIAIGKQVDNKIKTFEKMNSNG